MRVYEIPLSIRMLFEESYVNEETGEIIFDQETFEAITQEASDKLANCGRVIREWTAELEEMKAAKARIDARLKSKQKQIDWLSRLTLDGVMALGHKVEMPDIVVSSRKSSKVVVDPERLHADWWRVTEKREPDKTAIAKALKAGVAVEGAELTTNYSLALK